MCTIAPKSWTSDLEWYFEKKKVEQIWVKILNWLLYFIKSRFYSIYSFGSVWFVYFRAKVLLEFIKENYIGICI